MAALRLTLVLVLTCLAPASAKDCGRLPKGENPDVKTLAGEIAKISAAEGVPTEVIKAIAYQESRCQQWRSDGTFVYNKKDCGLGMMQLTGATARQFDVERLKDDWRYNLECGVKVLKQKWARAERKQQVPTDPGARRVLENWYYAIAYYWGGREESYLRKIFSHMEKRPGKLGSLLKRSVKVTIASEVIEGFEFGDRFTALEGNRIVDASGKAHKALTHLGTVGDEKTLATLDVWLSRGRKAAEKGKAKQALKYLLRIQEADYDTAHKVEAEALLAGLVAAAERLLAEARTKHEAGETGEAQKIYRKVARDYRGHEIAERAKENME